MVKQGATDPAPEAGFSNPTEGSEWLAERGRVPDVRPLYVLVWGSITDVAQAVHDAPDIKEKLRVYAIGSWNTAQDRAARDYLYRHHADLWWIEADTTFRGMYVGGNQEGDLGNKAFLDAHVKEHGALGRLLVEKLSAIKMGDTPSVLYLLAGDPRAPAGQHWERSVFVMSTGTRTPTTDGIPRARTRERTFAGAKNSELLARDVLAHCRRPWTSLHRQAGSGGSPQPVTKGRTRVPGPTPAGRAERPGHVCRLTLR